MTKKFYKGKIPFNAKTGALLSYERGEVEWQDNFQLPLKIHVSEIQRGRSAAHFIVKSVDDVQQVYPMFMKDVLEMMQQTEIINGTVSGVFTFCKRGTNYGLQFVKPVYDKITPKLVGEMFGYLDSTNSDLEFVWRYKHSVPDFVIGGVIQAWACSLEPIQDIAAKYWERYKRFQEFKKAGRCEGNGK